MKFIRFLSQETGNFEGVLRKRVTKVVALMGNTSTTGVRKNVPTTTVRNNLVTPIALEENSVADERPGSCDRGHLIALEFGGPEDKLNLVPMYGGFNSGGVWRQFEAALAQQVDNVFKCDTKVTIECKYDPDTNNEQRVPTSFDVKAETTTTPVQTWTRIILHPKPIPVLTGANAVKKAEYLQLIKEMEDNNWKVENQFEMKSFPSYRRKPVFPDIRPYAFLDYLEWKQATLAGAKALESWINSVVLSPTTEFGQKTETIKEVNRILNDGWLLSDDEDDVAYTMKYTVPGYPKGVLVEGDRDMAPQVDHIIPKSMSGSSCYSNAQILSGKYNNTLKAAIAPDDKEALMTGPIRKGRKRSLYNPYGRPGK